MDLRSFATSVESTLSSGEDESHSKCEEHKPKQHCGSITTKGKKGKYCSRSSTREYCKIWEKLLIGLTTGKVHSVRFVNSLAHF